MEQEAQCPYCGEPVTIEIDEGGGRRQEYVEDCSVCCRPWRVTVAPDPESEDGELAVVLHRQDD